MSQWRHVDWARSGKGPTFNPPGGGQVQLLEQCFTSCNSHYLHVLVCDHFDCGYPNRKDWCGGCECSLFRLFPLLIY